MAEDPAAPDPLAAPEAPDWVEERFRTAENPVEAQARSYAEAQREMNRVRSELDRERREFSEALETFSAQQNQPQQPQYPQQQDPLLAAAQRAYDDGDVTTLLAIQAQISQAATAQILDQRLAQLDERFTGATAQDKELTLRMAEDQLRREYGDRWDSDLVPKLQERIAANPGILPAQPSVEGYAAALGEQAKLVEYDRLVRENKQLSDERQAKLDAQTLAGGSARVKLQADPNDQAWADIKNADAGGWSKVVGG